MPHKRRIAVLTIFLSGLFAALGTGLSGGKTPLDGLLYDLALAARANLWPPTEGAQSVAIIGIDPGSLNEPELADLPRAMFGPIWAEILDAVIDGGADVVAFDLLFSYSANRRFPGHDTPFLRALARHRDQVVVGRSAATLPAPPVLGALRNDAGSLGLLEIDADGDRVYRRIGNRFVTRSGDVVATLAMSTLGRAGLDMGNEVLLAPRAHLEDIPGYALIDVLRCARSAPGALSAAFADRMVFVGSVLPEEDRKLSPGRFLTPNETARNAGARDCALDLLPVSSAGARTVPGVYLHAAAAEAVARDRLIIEPPDWVGPAVAAIAAAAAAATGLIVAPWIAAAVVVLAGAALWIAEVVFLQSLYWYPSSPAILALAGALVAAYLAHYFLEDRRRRRIQHAFGRYLAPAIVEQLMESRESLRLGGTDQPVSVMFADLSGFTALPTKVTAEELINLTNEYLAAIVEEIDATRGYVDKFIGDAVMAIWGAPSADPAHAYHAVRTALAIKRRIDSARREAESLGQPGFGVKIGIYSGNAVVGNVGSQNRFNYTAVGETVNIASRLEGLPGVYDCTVIIGTTTAEAVADEVFLRELDKVRVKGREEPLGIYEALAPRGNETEDQRNLVASYGHALALYRGGRFDVAQAKWLPMADRDGPSRVMAERAGNLHARATVINWDGV